MQGLLPNDGTQGAGPGVVERRGEDRRRRPTPRVSRYSLWGGRRRGARRTDEVACSFVDVYGPGFLFALLWIALMNVGDSFFTLVHLQGGASEVNPVAAYFLTTGRLGFVTLKSAVIGGSLLVLCVHKNYPLARAGLWVAAIAYTLLNAYHLLLFVL